MSLLASERASKQRETETDRNKETDGQESDDKKGRGRRTLFCFCAERAASQLFWSAHPPRMLLIGGSQRRARARMDGGWGEWHVSSEQRAASGAQRQRAEGAVARVPWLAAARTRLSS
jgi:hypothetical protein